MLRISCVTALVMTACLTGLFTACSSALPGCQSDIDCKGDRICQDTQCVDSPSGGGNGTDAGWVGDGYLGVVAGEEGAPISGTIRFSKRSATVAGSLALRINAQSSTLSFQSDAGFEYLERDGGLYAMGYPFDTNSDGMRGSIVMGVAAADAGSLRNPGDFFGTLTFADGGQAARFAGGAANGSSRTFCGTFAGPVAGTWNFATTNNSVNGVFAGTSASDGKISGKLTGTVAGSSISLDWAVFVFGFVCSNCTSGTASGTVSGTRVTGAWGGYGDGGTWTSDQTCP